MIIYEFVAYDRWGVDIVDKYFFDSLEKAEEFQKDYESNPVNEVFTESGLRDRDTFINKFDVLCG